ncbi:unnamed protein product [Microthlaspi erraticum]|uniref:Integrase catalytic domain-containing protein n=1 Tax=Microthlaspi erraticum TaxID=1685480 RepID=A0A6D2J2P7_9BRAS|nr:unnamed protein product [Microthlaspi erraticum]
MIDNFGVLQRDIELWRATTTPTNHPHYLIIVDHFTRYTWFYPLQLKSHVKQTFILFKELTENRFQTRIGTLFSDNGGEFIALRHYLSSKGISHLTSPPHTPEHNGLSERRHRHIVETGLSLLHQAKMPNTYWSYAFSTAVYLINRMPTPVLSMNSPYRLLFQQEPNCSKLKIFGCLSFPWLRPYRSHKLETRSTPCVFLGYSLTQNAYLCLDPTSNRLYVSRHVRFDEQTFPFRSLSSSSAITAGRIEDWCPPVTLVPLSPLITSSSVPPPSSELSPPNDPPNFTDTTPPENVATASLPTPTTAESNSSASPETSPPVSRADLSHQSVSANSDHTPPTSSQAQAQSQSPSGPRSPTVFNNHSPQSNSTQSATTVHDSETSPSPSSDSSASSPTNSPPADVAPPPSLENAHTMVTRGKTGIRKPNSRYALSVVNAKRDDWIPTTVAQALADPRWRGAMGDEYNSQLRHRTYSLVPAAPNQNIVGTRWIYTIKYAPDGSVRRLKARFVAKGYSQQPGVDYTETFSPVIKSTFLRTVLDVTVSRSWPIKQLDVNTAFLQGTLKEEVYINQPAGFVDPEKPTHVCRLHKALYGLKQAPRAWYLELSNFVLSTGFINSVADTSLFILKRDWSLLYMLVYVDDIIVTSNDQRLLDQTLQSLATRFSVKDPEDLNYFLGIEAHRTPSGLHLTQRRYILDLLTRCNMLDAKPVTTPMASTPKLTLGSGIPLTDPTQYRSVVGSLQYLSFTRPDVSYAVNRLSQFMHAPTSDHWQAAKRVLRYLAGTSSHGLFYSKENPTTLHAYSDADWGGDRDDYISTNAYIVYLGKHPIFWSSKKQKGVARSSTEAEYRSVANASAELRWICSLLSELGVQIPAPPVIYCDNVGATYLCANPVFHSRMKHLALDYHFIRNQVASGILRVVHVSSKDQLADALTKPLTCAPFTDLTSKIGVSCTLSILRGRIKESTSPSQ